VRISGLGLVSLEAQKGCHGLQKRAIQAGIRLIRRADARRLGGPIQSGHDNFNRGY